jgi:hypothetical protein
MLTAATDAEVGAACTHLLREQRDLGPQRRHLPRRDFLEDIAITDIEAIAVVHGIEDRILEGW